jgi:hypothetical protein
MVLQYKVSHLPQLVRFGSPVATWLDHKDFRNSRSPEHSMAAAGPLLGEAQSHQKSTQRLERNRLFRRG